MKKFKNRGIWLEAANKLMQQLGAPLMLQRKELASALQLPAVVP